MHGGDPSLLFSWLPTITPPLTKIIVSGDCDSEYHPVLCGICPFGVKLDMWDTDDVQDYLSKNLDMRGRRITIEQMQYIRKGVGGHCIPLVAQLILHEAASWPSYMENLTDIPIRSQPSFLVGRMLDKLERKHGEVIIRACFGYIASSTEGGLSTNELLDILSLDDQLLKMVENLLPPKYLLVRARAKPPMLATTH